MEKKEYRLEVTLRDGSSENQKITESTCLPLGKTGIKLEDSVLDVWVGGYSFVIIAVEEKVE